MQKAQSAGAIELPTASFQRGKSPHPNEFPGCDIKQSDGEAPVMLEIWGMCSNPIVAIVP